MLRALRTLAFLLTDRARLSQEHDLLLRAIKANKPDSDIRLNASSCDITWRVELNPATGSMRDYAFSKSDSPPKDLGQWHAFQPKRGTRPGKQVAQALAGAQLLRLDSKVYAFGELWLSYADGEDEAPLLRGGPRP